MLTKELLDVLACPVCRSDLSYDGKELKCKKCRKIYKIKHGIPIFI